MYIGDVVQAAEEGDQNGKDRCWLVLEVKRMCSTCTRSGESVPWMEEH